MNDFRAGAKRRTITLTNRSPVSVIEDEWPVTAHGDWDNGEPPSSPSHASVQIRVRRNSSGAVIVYAKCKDLDDNVYRKGARVGRLLSSQEAVAGLSEHILRVRDDLLERVEGEAMRAHVVRAVDRCFADLPPSDE